MDFVNLGGILDINISEGGNLALFSLFLLTLEGIAAWWVYRYRKEMIGGFLVPATLLVLSVILAAIGMSFPSEDVGPIVIPRLWGTILVIFCVAVIFAMFRDKSYKDPKPGNIKMLALVIGLLGVYFYSMELIGYFISSFLFLAIMMYLLSYRNHKVIWTVSVCWVGFSYLIFYKMLYISLPLGLVYESFFE